MTAIVGPILSLTYKSKRRPGTYKYRTIRSIEGNSEFRILACVHSTRNAGGLVNLLASSNPSKESPIFTFGVHLVELVGHASAMLIVHDTCKAETAAAAAKDPLSQPDSIAEAFEQLEGEDFTVQPLTAVSPYNTMHEDICSLAEDKRVTLTILPFHIQSTVEGPSESSANSPFRSVNKNVLDRAPCSAAVFVDRGFHSRPLSESHGGFRHHFAMIFLGGRDDREALAYAWRMAKGPRVCLTVIRFIATKTVAEMSPDGLNDIDNEDEEGGILKAIAESEKEKPLDDQYIEQFKLKSRDDPSIRLVEEVAENGEDVVRLVSNNAECRYDLYVVGRAKGVVSPLTSGLSDWSEYPELGPLGDILVCSSFAAEASVLVVKQGVGSVDDQEGVGIVREEFGHMTWHPPAMNKAGYAPFIHRRVRVNDDDDHL